MRTCSKCGEVLLDGENNCPKCGAPVKSEYDQGSGSDQSSGNYSQTGYQAPPFGNLGTDRTAEYDINDIRANKWVHIIAYLGILFFLPLVVYPDSRVCRFHANQALIQLILGAVLGVVSGIFSGVSVIPGVGLMFSIISGVFGSVVSLLELFIFIFELVNIINDKVVEIPVIGRFRLIN